MSQQYTTSHCAVSVQQSYNSMRLNETNRAPGADYRNATLAHSWAVNSNNSSYARGFAASSARAAWTALHAAKDAADRLSRWNVGIQQHRRSSSSIRDAHGSRLFCCAYPHHCALVRWTRIVHCSSEPVLGRTRSCYETEQAKLSILIHMLFHKLKEPKCQDSNDVEGKGALLSHNFGHCTFRQQCCCCFQQQ